MPNHFHAIILIKNPIVGAGLVSARSLNKGETKEAETSPAPTLCDFICILKSKHTNDYIKSVKNNILPKFQKRIWQRNYHDHIIRNEAEYLKIWEYIDTNPQKWQDDCYYSNVTV